MAVSFTLVSASPEMLKYKLLSTGAENGDLAAATMLANFALKAGTPLYDLLKTTLVGGPAAIALAFDRTDLNISILQRVAAASWIITATDVGSKVNLNCASAAADAVGSYLSITYRHTYIR
jgi:hypothetical protein